MLYNILGEGGKERGTTVGTSRKVLGTTLLTRQPTGPQVIPIHVTFYVENFHVCNTAHNNYKC